VSDPRLYPDRPFLAVSAAVMRAGQILIVRRARRPAHGVYTFPGGVVEAGETLAEAVIREIREETSLAIEPCGLAGHREWIARDNDGRVERHFVILSFAARWLSGEFVPNDELDDGQWVRLSEIAGFRTTEGLAEIAVAASALVGGEPA
jgi:ADP-ribose pyrophosphatase YjhB (NUDIX family)